MQIYFNYNKQKDDKPDNFFFKAICIFDGFIISFIEVGCCCWVDIVGSILYASNLHISHEISFNFSIISY